MLEELHDEIERASATSPYQTSDIRRLAAACGIRRTSLMLQLVVEALRELIDGGRVICATEEHEPVRCWLLPAGFDGDELPDVQVPWVECEPFGLST